MYLLVLLLYYFILFFVNIKCLEQELRQSQVHLDCVIMKQPFTSLILKWKKHKAAGGGTANVFVFMSGGADK